MTDPAGSTRALPTGIVTFLFTDIEGSTRLLSELGDGYQAVVETHAAILRAAITDHHGIEVNTEGDAFFAVFTRPGDALGAATQAQVALATAAWPAGRELRVRMGIHSGEGRHGGDDYIGIDVNRAARIASAAHGGQVLVSDATRSLIGAGHVDFSLRDLGLHDLKDLDTPERLAQLIIASLPDDFPPPRAQRAGNVPEPATAFIGRERDVEAVSDLLGQSRLVTITGPGGSGKTRLALRVASDMAAVLPDGAYFVPLDTLREPDLLKTAIASSLELSIADEDPMSALKAHLSERQLLLVLDNFEQIAPAASDVDDLIKHTTSLTILATSQSPLGVYGEHEYPVPPLGTPDPSRPPPAERMLDYEAVALFDARARAAKPSFRIDEGNASALTELVARLDGQPLAIELAAARSKLLSPKAILDRLEKRLDLLSSSARNLPDRQRTLRGAIDWSYGLLQAEEQHVFDRLGVFAGGITIDDAEAMVSPDGECAIDIFDGLASLVEKSLLRQTEVDDEPRFSQLESIRSYAVERLTERGEADLMNRRLAENTVAQVESAERYLDRADDQGWFARLDADQDNIRAALRWSIAQEEAELAQRIVGPVWRFWVRKGLLAEGTWWTDDVLAMNPKTSIHRAKALIAQGSLAYWRGDYTGAGVPYAAALAAYQELGDEEGVTQAAYNLGYAQEFAEPPDVDGALTSFGVALDGFKAADDAAMTQSTLFTIGMIRAYRGDLDLARELYDESLAMNAGDVRPRSGLAALAFNEGDYGEARRLLRELADLTRDVPDLAFRIVQLELWVPVEVTDGDPELAMRLHGAAQRLRDEISGGPPPDRTIVVDAVAVAREKIGEDETNAAIAEGRQLDPEEALASAVARG